MKRIEIEGKHGNIQFKIVAEGEDAEGLVNKVVEAIPELKPIESAVKPATVDMLNGTR